MSSTRILDSPSPDGGADAVLLADLFDSAEEDQFAVNTRAAYQAETFAEIIVFAKMHPHVYAHTEHPDAVEIAERAVIRDAALRFQVSENTIRSLAAVAGTAQARLPGLWRRAKDGYATIRQLETAVTMLAVLGDDTDNTRQFDDDLTDAVVRLSSTGFAARARRIARRLSQIPPETRHRDAAARRRVIVDPAEDGMAWLSAYLPLHEAIAAKRRLTSSAKHVAKTDRDGRTRDQIRADLLSAWLRGVGTPTAVKTKVFVTIPVTLLTPDAQVSIRRGGARARGSGAPPAGTGNPGVAGLLPRTRDHARLQEQSGIADQTGPPPGTGPNLNDEPLLDARDPIDPATAIAALLHEGAFRRVITDPVNGAILDMDRRARIATPAQREWLTLAYATCAVDGCEHPAADSDIDHWLDYHGPHAGRTNIRNLNPFCGNDHVLKTRSKLRYVRSPDGTVRIQSPVTHGTSPSDDDFDGLDAYDHESTAEEYADPPDDPDEIRRITSARGRLTRPEYGDDPPF